MKERGILFSGEMVRAIDEGKTQTRRVMNPQPLEFSISTDWHETPCFTGGSTSPFPGSRPARWWRFDDATNGILEYSRLRQKATPAMKRRASQWLKHKPDGVKWSEGEVVSMCPYGSVGDRLWVKETYRSNNVGAFLTRQKEDPQPEVYYRATYEGMVSWKWKPSIFMPRALSRITLEITSIRVERLHSITYEDIRAEGYPWRPGIGTRQNIEEAEEWWESLWTRINGAESWKANPWLWVISFKRVKA